MSRLVLLLDEESMRVLLNGLSGARRMARHLSRERNRSSRFQAFVAGIETVSAGLAANETPPNG